MGMPELRMSFEDRAALASELESNLKHGRAFIKDASGIEALTDCKLHLVHPEDGAELALSAQAVLVCDSGPMRGLGVQLRPFDAQVLKLLEDFVAGVRAAPAAPAERAVNAGEPSDEGTGTGTGKHADDSETATGAETAADSETGEVDSATDSASGSDAAGDELLDADGASDDDALPADQQRQPARHERLRKLSQNEQQKVARHGDLNDRVMLERIYGKHVWEGLLHNPKLTVPEVARIARKGTMPRPLLELIVDNNAWIQAPIVRRALLGNPRVSGEAILKLLRITPKHELRAISKTTTYSAQVREAARKVLDL